MKNNPSCGITVCITERIKNRENDSQEQREIQLEKCNDCVSKIEGITKTIRKKTRYIIAIKWLKGYKNSIGLI